MTEQQGSDSVLESTNPFYLNEWRVEPATGYILCGEVKVHLEPRVMTVLRLLAGHAGDVVSRERLEAEAWPGMVVGYDALATSILKLRKALGDDSRNPRYIETVSKKGYRLIAPVSVEGPRESDSTGTGRPASGWQKQWNVRGLAAVLATATIIVAAFLVSKYDGKHANLKTLAVIPFINISNDAENEYFVEGVTDDIITNLSNLPGILVIARSGTYSYKGQEIDPKKVGNELGADYLVQGSIRKSGKRWRINAKLIDATSGTLLWAKRFESNESSLLDTQDELAISIASSLALELNPDDKHRLQHPVTTNFEAYDLFLQGQKLFKERTQESNEAAQDVYRRAIKLDPSFARAHSALAVAMTVEYWRNWSDSPTETLNRALSLARLSVSLDPNSPQSYWALGYVLMYQKQHNKAVDAVKHAIELAPNFADGYGLLALINNQLGNGKEAARLIKKGMELSPHYSWDYPYNLGRAYYVMGTYDDAVKYLQIALERNEQAVNPRLFLVTSYVAMGRIEDAQWEAEKIRTMNPATTLSHLEDDYPIANQALLKTFLDQLRKAGLPEK